MLHDLLFALHGHPGSIFKETADGEVKVVPGLPFLSPAEETSINRLLRLSSSLISFKKFVEAHKRTLGFDEHEPASDCVLYGLYLSAFCDGLDAVLEPYKQTLLDIEKEILADPLLTFTHAIHCLEPFHLLFDALLSLICTIKSRKNHGCQILTTVYAASQTGNRQVQESMRKILQKLHIVLYNQLAAWLLHGLLIDRHGEFFIAKQDRKPSNESTFINIDGSTLETQMDMFYIRGEMLPSYLPSREVDIILFIGSSLHLFEEDIHKIESLSVDSGGDLALVPRMRNPEKHREGIELKRQEFRMEFLLLQKQEKFSLEKLQSCLDKIRSTVAKDLWDICVVQAKLVSHLTMLKDFFLLGYGELYMVFLEEVGNIMSRPISKMTEYDVNRAFMRSAVKVQLEEDDTALQNFRVTVTNKVSKEGDKPPAYPQDASDILETGDTWSSLGMTFNVKWPLHIIFTPTVLAKYNKLFKFLLRVRRTQLALQNLWALQMSSVKYSLVYHESDAELRRNISYLTLRMHMSHMVDSLQYYLQADVLESHFSNLLSKIRDPNSTDFDQIIIAHDHYLTALLAQCFILSTPVFRSLIDVLNICQQFCEVVTASIQTGTMAAREVISNRVDRLTKDFERQSSLLFHTLSAVCNQQSNPHLAQFLLLLDYNKFYTLNL